MTEAHGAPGYEAEIRLLLHGLPSPLGALDQGKMGSLVCRVDGPAGGPKVMLAGHADEIGFMVRHVTKEGAVKFLQLGGWWDQVLLGHRVVIKARTGDVPGIIGAKPIHLLAADERKRVVEKRDMYIDVGASSAEEVEAAGVRVVARLDAQTVAGLTA